MNDLDLGLITFLIVISGVIAFAGNYVGRRAGKKRISILGIRPYYTSMIITVITGILITTITLIILINVSSSMRYALESKERLQETINLLSQKLSSTQSELSIRADELSAAIEYQKKLEKNIQNQIEKVESLEKEVKKLDTALKEREKKLEEKEISLEENKRKLNDLEAQREKLEKQIGELSAIVAELNADRKKLKEEEENLRKEMNSMGKEVASLRAEKEKLVTQVDTYKRELSELKEQIISYRAQSEMLKKDIAKKEEELRFLRNQKIIFQGREVLLVETVNGPKSEQEAGDIIKYLIEKTKDIVRYRYLNIDENPPKEFSFIYDPEDIEFAVESLKKDQQRLIRIRVKNNTLIGEPINLSIESLKSKLVFSKNEVITFKFISAKLPRNKIIEELNLLLKDVEREGLRRGMLPDPITGPLGSVPYESLLNLSVRIKVQYSKTGSALVVAKASSDIYTAGPLSLKFELR
ncbi:TPA: DUF3084 domain-containing protein [bacterium]|nr:DUF3084 domain-containing protein [bacterium]